MHLKDYEIQSTATYAVEKETIKQIYMDVKIHCYSGEIFRITLRFLMQNCTLCIKQRNVENYIMLLL